MTRTPWCPSTGWNECGGRVNECGRRPNRTPVKGEVCQPVCHHRGDRFVVVTYCSDVTPTYWFLDLVEDRPNDDVEVECLGIGTLGVDDWMEAWPAAVERLRSDVGPRREERIVF